MKTRNKREQEDQDLKHGPAIEITDNPEEAKMISSLVFSLGALREDDTPEEGALMLASMALTLANIAAAHQVGQVDGEQADLGVGFAIEGGFLAAAIEESVIAPAFRYQEQWERNLLHDVDPAETRKARMRYRTEGMTADFCDSLLLPSERARMAFLKVKQLKLAETMAQNEPKQPETAGQPPKKALPTIEEFMAPLLKAHELITFNRQETVQREVMDYRVFIAEASRSVGFEQRVMKAHRGRFMLHAKVDSCADLDRIGKILEEYSGHRSVRNGDATFTLRADPVLCVGPNVLNEALSRGQHRKPFLKRLLWLVESSVGCELPDPRGHKAPRTHAFSDFRIALNHAMERRINFTNDNTHELTALKWELVNWRRFLRERERHCPGITGAVKNLPFALCYGLGAMMSNSTLLCGDEVMALARWLVMRMVNRLAAASFEGSHSRVERLAQKLAKKLATDGPLTARELTRKCSKLKAADCQQALDWLEDRQIAAECDSKWGILGDVTKVHAFAAAD
jgi:hypothetical protein